MSLYTCAALGNLALRRRFLTWTGASFMNSCAGSHVSASWVKSHQRTYGCHFRCSSLAETKWSISEPKTIMGNLIPQIIRNIQRFITVETQTLSMKLGLRWVIKSSTSKTKSFRQLTMRAGPRQTISSFWLGLNGTEYKTKSPTVNEEKIKYDVCLLERAPFPNRGNFTMHILKRLLKSRNVRIELFFRKRTVRTELVEGDQIELSGEPSKRPVNRVIGA